MIDFEGLKRGVLSYLRTLLVVLILLLLWVFCVRSVYAQPLPLVRAHHQSFVSYYDIEKHNPALVVYPLEFSHFAGVQKVGSRHFKMDTQLPRPRVKDSDYSNTGYVRGHLCSAGDRDSNKAWLKETYLTSNLVPMTMVCNSGAFKVMEDSCRALAKAGHRLLIGRAPVYKDIPRFLQFVIQNRFCITIPEAFFCVAMCRDCDLRYVALIPNDGTNRLEHVSQVGSADTIDVLQLRSGQPSDVIHSDNVSQKSAERLLSDIRISVLLTNIFGLWCREEYEIITR